VHHVCAESNAVECMDQFSINVVFQTDSYWALTALSITGTTSLTNILLVYFVTNIAFPFSLNSTLQTEIERVSHRIACFGFWNFCMVHSTLAYVSTNYHVSQFGQWNQENFDTWQNWYTNCIALRYDIKNTNLPVNTSDDAGVATVCLSESNGYIVISWGGYQQGYELRSSTGFPCWRGAELGSTAGTRLGIFLFYCGFSEPSLLWQLPGHKVHCGICNIPGTISRHSMSSPNVLSAGATALSSVCGFTTSGTLTSDLPYLEFLS